MEKQKIDKFGKSIAIHHKKRIQYTKGQVLGNNITFLEEIEPDTRIKQPNRLVNFRRALFECYCGKQFKGKISLIVNKRVMSCGCLRLEKLKEFHTKRGEK